MEPTTKILLKNSLDEFRASERHKQDKMIQLVEQRIKQHENSLKTIGYGYADHFVKAGKVFLRIVNNNYGVKTSR